MRLGYPNKRRHGSGLAVALVARNIQRRYFLEMIIPKNYKAVGKRALKLAVKHGWRLERDGSFGVEATIHYLEFMESQIITKKLKHATMLSYLSGLQSFYMSLNVDWKPTLEHFQVRRKLKEIRFNPLIPTQNSTQDEEIELKDLEEFCGRMTGSIDDVIAASIATSLFWGLGRISELIHSADHQPLEVDNLIETKGLLRILLERPKRERLGYASQYISPIQSSGRSRAQSWLILLQMVRKRDGKLCLLTLENGMRPSFDWFISKFKSNVTRRFDKLGQCSFRAGGLTHLAALGYDLDILRIMGRWKSEAFQLYLRNHPHVIQAQLEARKRALSPP
jgi:hypothetical protein